MKSDQNAVANTEEESKGTIAWQWRFWGLHFGRGASGVAIIAAGVTDLYCHSEPPLTSGKLCFIINFIGGHRGAGHNFYWGRLPCPPPPLNRPCCPGMLKMQKYAGMEVLALPGTYRGEK